MVDTKERAPPAPDGPRPDPGAPAAPAARVGWLTIAFRNILKNGRRSLFTITAIAFGFAAINLFGGFTRYVFTSLTEAYIYLMGNGHLTVFRADFDPHSLLSNQGQLISARDQVRVRALCASDPRVLVCTPRLGFRGLISNGNESTIFMGNGKVCSDSGRIFLEASGRISKLNFADGHYLTDENRIGIGLCRGLARKLDLKLGSPATLIGTTVNGQVNALDAEVIQLVDASMDILDYMVIEAPIALAQELLDTDGVDRITLLLTREADLAHVRSDLSRRMAQEKLRLKVYPWYELDRMTPKVERMFRVIFLFLFLIFLVIAIMSVVNTIGMAVTERTREIGTLRALGLKRWGIVTLFACESALLATLGSVLGVVLTLASWCLIHIIDPQWMPPTVPREIPLEVHLVPGYMVLTFVSLLLLALVAGIWPARRAARKSIVDALGHA